MKESTWNILGIEKFPNAIVEVYNRNGQRVFRAKNYQNNWTGDPNKYR
ncbi:MAG: gliding motility-associated C-terminal domain-containing protein [Flavobacteriaceae bacterium]